MSMVDTLENLDRTILRYQNLPARAEELISDSRRIGNIWDYNEWIEKAKEFLNDKQLCELELGILIGSSVRRSPFGWDMFQKLITVMEWQEECQMKEEVMEEEDDDLSSVGMSAVWDSTEDESGDDEDVDFVRSASSASGHVNDPIVIDE
ncbi:hypothetical protein JAAARDRAFT_188464 [Jaapia argillacea MUCL 33604]|uniref:Uncharacterized protein n=1 Tax=Jaapia argillacea MUCL 33604 TaxID=933084 RepID=A0A067QR71_9AGAM|nr:hypothetical protein JAAARDRAFT_188464 [Jaapia argillacea MUCL 33604]